MEQCDGCGFIWDLVPYGEVAARISEAATAFRRLLMPVDRPVGWAQRVATRPADGVWSALEYACHVRDVLFVQRDRVYVALVEDSPAFGPMYREERVDLGRYGDEDLGEVVTQLEVGARLLARTLGVLDVEQFRRTAVYGYPTVQARTIAWVGAQSLHEMLHHTNDIAAQLAPLEAHLDRVRAAPKDFGRVEMIVRRPDTDVREVLTEAELSTDVGVVGDNWLTRGSRQTTDGSANPDAQLNIMNSAAAALICGERDRWSLAGDQLIVDLDLSGASLPAGSRLSIGGAIIEVTPLPHRGCAKFSARFGRDALRLVNSAQGRALNLRGVNAKVVVGGAIRQGDVIRRTA